MVPESQLQTNLNNQGTTAAHRPVTTVSKKQKREISLYGKNKDLYLVSPQLAKVNLSEDPLQENNLLSPTTPFQIHAIKAEISPHIPMKKATV